jgi:peptidoglycan/LPS O-acetylase OafA/YrhL
MRRVLRFVAYVNAVYQGLVGLVGVFSPALIAALFHIGVPDPSEAGVIRLLAAFICGNAMLLALVGQQRDGARILAKLAFANGAVVLISNVAICAGGDLPWSTLAVGMIGTIALEICLVLWLRTPGILGDLPARVWAATAPGIPREEP